MEGGHEEGFIGEKNTNKELMGTNLKLFYLENRM